ncbi:ribosome assembly RNA-binding protein YhbY [Ectobacillus funiculus]
MLTGKQKNGICARRRTISHRFFQVGKGGVNEHLIKHIQEAIETRELIKVSVLQNCEEDRHEVAEELSSGAGAELVQVIGSTIVLYKESQDHKQIVLP